MSVLIKGMDMPENCTDCNLMADGWCYAVEAWDHKYDDLSSERRPDWCPLVEIKTPHGRLIDATGIDNATATKEDYPDGAILIPKGAILAAPTIIEAEE